MDNGHIGRLIIDTKECLEREIREGFARVDEQFAHVDEQFDLIETRLTRQGGPLRSRQTNLLRLNDWSERIDELLLARDKRIDDLEARLRKLESAG